MHEACPWQPLESEEQGLQKGQALSPPPSFPPSKGNLAFVSDRSAASCEGE